MSIRIKDEVHNAASIAANDELFNGLKRIAETMAKAEALPQGVNPHGALLLMLAGADWGIPPIPAVSRLFLVSGRIAPSAQMAVALAYRDHQVTLEVIERSPERAEVLFRRPGHPDKTIVWDKAAAQRAGLWGKSGPWSKHSDDMLIARATMTGLRLVAPEVMAGIYSVEELQDGLAPDATEDLRALSQAFPASSTDLDGDAARATVKPVLKAKATAPATPAPKPTPPAPTPLPTPAPVQEPAAPPAPVQEPETAPWEENLPPAAKAAPQVDKEQVLREIAESKQAEGLTATRASQVLGVTNDDITEAKLDLTPSAHMALVMKGTLPDQVATSKNILAAVTQQVYAGDLDKAKAALGAQVKAYGAPNAAKLSPIDFMALYHWAHELVDAAVSAKAQEIPDFDPKPVAVAAPAETEIDAKINELFFAAAEKGLDEQANEIFNDTGYADHAEDSLMAVKIDAFQRLTSLVSPSAA